MIDYSYYRSIRVEKQEGIAILTLNRPERKNTLDAPLHLELERIWRDVARDREVRVVVLTAAGEAFSAGPDWDYFQRLRADRSLPRITMEGARQLIWNMLEVPQPIIAAVNGDALSLGATLVVCCDIIIAAETACLADTHVRYGLVAGDGGAAIWPLHIGLARAKEFLMTGDPIRAPEAARIGLINRAVPRDRVLPTALELARRLASGPAQAIQWTKLSVNLLLRQQVNLILDASLALEWQTMRRPEHRAAIDAFLEGREPRFREE